MAKIYSLAMLAIIALITPLLEVATTGHVDPFSKFGIAETLLSIVPIYWWYYADKAQRQFHAGPFLNAGVIAVAIIALPIYFIKSRGWKRGSVSIVMAGGILAATYLLELIGEQLAILLQS